MRNLVKTIIFLLVITIIVLLIQKPFIPFNAQDTNQNATFYEMEEDSIDVIFAGTSSIMVGMSPLKLYEDTGITSYVRGSSVQIPEITYLNIKEALKYQKPKVVVVAMMAYFGEFDYDGCEPWIRRGMDYKRLSTDKVYVAKSIVDNSQEQDVASFVLPLLRYHNRWSALIDDGVSEDYGKYDYMHGQYPVYKSRPLEDVREEKMARTDVKIYEHAIPWYTKIADLCEENDIQLIIMQPPNINWSTGKHNALADFAEEHNALFVDYNVDGIIEECGLDLNTDFYDPLHVNAIGSVKATEYFAKYLTEECGLEASDVSDDVKAQFEKDIKTFKNDLKTTEFTVLDRY